MIVGNQLPMPSFSVASEISEIFSETGNWCADFFDSAISIFQAFCNSALDFLSTKVDSAEFSDFWGIINTIASVFSRIAGPLVVLFFVYKLFEEISDSRSQLDIFSFARSCLKVGIASVLVSNATEIVKYIFNIGSLLAKLVVRLAGNNSIDFNTNITLSSEYREILTEGITGLTGFLIFIVYLIGGIALVVCGVVIAIAAFQRIYKMFVLIPFGAFSFSAYTLPDAHGHEIFSGYLKGLIRTALEACIISLIITFTFVLMKNESMEEILPLDLSGREVVSEGAITNDNEMIFLYYYVTEGATATRLAEGEDFNYDTVGADVINFAFRYTSGSTLNSYCYINGKKVTSDVLYTYYMSATSSHGYAYPISITVCKYEGNWKDSLLVLLYMLFPAMLAASAVKEVDKFTGIIVGGGA